MNKAIIIRVTIQWFTMATGSEMERSLWPNPFEVKALSCESADLLFPLRAVKTVIDSFKNVLKIIKSLMEKRNL